MTSEAPASTPLAAGRAHAAGDAAARRRAARRPAAADRSATRPGRTASCRASPRRGPRRCAAAGVARGDRVALMLRRTGSSCSRPSSPAAGSAPSAVPINTASMGPQIDYVLRDSGARLLVIEAGFVERLANAGLGETALQAIWVVGERAAGEADATRLEGVACSAWPALPASSPRIPCPRSSRRSCRPTSSPSSTPRAPPARPRACSARRRSTTGGACTAPRSSASAPTTCSARRCRCSTSTPSTPSRRPRSPAPASSSSRASRPRPSGRRCARARPPSSTCSARWCRSCSRSRHRRRSARTACASASAPACRRAPRRRSASAPACRCSKATARPRPTSSSPARPTGRAPAAWAGCDRASRPASSTRTTSSCRRRGRRAAAARRRAVRVRERLLRQARGDRRRLAQPLVPHRRPGGARGRRRLPLRRPHQGRDPPARREHLVVRGRAGAAEPSRGGGGRGLSGALGAGRRRGDGRRRRARGRGARPGRARRLLPHAAAVLRDPALRRGRRRPAAHRERQGAEVQAARARRDAGRVGPQAAAEGGR